MRLEKGHMVRKNAKNSQTCMAGGMKSGGWGTADGGCESKIFTRNSKAAIPLVVEFDAFLAAVPYPKALTREALSPLARASG